MTDTTPVSESIGTNESNLKAWFGGSTDIKRRPLIINGTQALGVFADGLCDEIKISQTVLGPLTAPKAFISGKHTVEQILLFVGGSADVTAARTLESAFKAVLEGNYVLFLAGEPQALIFGVQGYAKKAVGEPPSEQTEFGSQEGFTDNIKDNASLLRRRLRTPELVFERLVLGEKGNTPVLLCYMSDNTDMRTLCAVRNRLLNMDLPAVLGSGWLRPFLNGSSRNLFSGSGVTERPDTLAAKLLEGRIGVMIDGTPFAIVVPYLFADHFHSPDDYLTSPAYALFIRLLRYLCFAAAIALPGMFVAVCSFHPKMLPSDIMYDIAAAEARTPFPLAVEAITIHLIYEIVREAGLRMPRAAGHAVSIVGALVIGEAAVSAGLIAAPMLIVVGITTISSAVVPKLHDRIAVFRMILIVAGGISGLFGVFLGLAFLLFQMFALSPFGVPFTYPFSPFSAREQTDAVFRASWKRLAKRNKTDGRTR